MNNDVIAQIFLVWKLRTESMGHEAKTEVIKLVNELEFLLDNSADRLRNKRVKSKPRKRRILRPINEIK